MRRDIMAMTSISLKLDENLKKRVQQKAEENGISMSAFISLVLTNAVDHFSISIDEPKEAVVYEAVPSTPSYVAEARGVYHATMGMQNRQKESIKGIQDLVQRKIVSKDVQIHHTVDEFNDYYDEMYGDY